MTHADTPLAGEPLPGFGPPPARPYAATSEEAVVVGDLLVRHVPALARGELEIAAIARYPGVLTKVAVRRRFGTKLSGRPVGLVVGVGADYVNRVSAQLEGERLHVLQWHGNPGTYIAEALGISYLSPIDLSLTRRVASVLLGAIDVRGIRGRRGINLELASSLTGWRIRLREIGRSPAWKALEDAQREHRTVTATAQTRVSKGLVVSVYGISGLLPTGQVRGVHRNTPANEVDALMRERLGQELQVHVIRLDPDTGHVFMSERTSAGRQLALPLYTAMPAH
jgi:transcription antitermination factor NusA-like protein